jgi:hypothetical protein
MNKPLYIMPRSGLGFLSFRPLNEKKEKSFSANSASLR